MAFEIKRRRLLKLLANAIISLTTLSFLTSIYFLKRGAPESIIPEGQEPVFIADVADLKEATAIKFEIGGEPGILINFKGSLQAFSATCTHMGCPVSGKLLATKGVIECPCHGSVFDPLTGERIAGPASNDLRKLEIEIKEGKIYALPY
jgi:Rieske Fe-S protein